jgi:hypothetical protein
VSNRLKKLAERKQALIAQCARERDELAALLGQIRSPFDVGGTLVAIGRALKAHPLVAAGVSSFLVSGYAGRLLKTAGELVSLWRLIVPLRDWWTKRRRHP